MLALASETPPQNPKKIVETEAAEARKGRQLGSYGQGDKEIVVDIQDDEKNQYYETNYDTSKSICIHKAFTLILCQKYIAR